MTRTATISEAFLRWLSTTETQPPPEDFLDDPASVVDGIQVIEQELVPAVVRLIDYGLVSPKPGVMGRPIPVRTRITSDGRICVGDFACDIDAWSKRNAPNVNTDNSVSLTAGRDLQAAVHAQNTTQFQNASDVNLTELRRAAEYTRDGHRSLDFPDGVGTYAVETSNEILAELEKSQPDKVKLKGLGERLRNAVALAAGGGTILKLIVEALGAAGV